MRSHLIVDGLAADEVDAPLRLEHLVHVLRPPRARLDADVRVAPAGAAALAVKVVAAGHALGAHARRVARPLRGAAVVRVLAEDPAKARVEDEAGGRVDVDVDVRGHVVALHLWQPRVDHRGREPVADVGAPARLAVARLGAREPRLLRVALRVKVVDEDLSTRGVEHTGLATGKGVLVVHGSSRCVRYARSVQVAALATVAEARVEAVDDAVAARAAQLILLAVEGRRSGRVQRRRKG